MGSNSAGYIVHLDFLLSCLSLRKPYCLFLGVREKMTLSFGLPASLRPALDVNVIPQVFPSDAVPRKLFPLKNIPEEAIPLEVIQRDVFLLEVIILQIIIVASNEVYPCDRVCCCSIAVNVLCGLQDSDVPNIHE